MSEDTTTCDGCGGYVTGQGPMQCLRTQMPDGSYRAYQWTDAAGTPIHFCEAGVQIR